MEKLSQKFWAGGFLYDHEREAVFLHQRDGNTKINPHKWAFFGGLAEGDETPIECYQREFLEEIGISIELGNIIPLCDYLNKELQTYRYVFYSLSTMKREEFVLGEGAGFDWVPLDLLDRLDLTAKTRADISFFIARHKT